MKIVSTAGETSNEDDIIMENRLSEPGLTMEHLVDSDIFDLVLEDEQSN